MQYQVNVGNVGTVYSGENEEQARETFREYVALSRYSRSSRAFGEPVDLIVDGEPEREWTGSEGTGYDEEYENGKEVPSLFDLIVDDEIEGDVFALDSWRIEDSEEWIESDCACDFSDLGISIPFREIEERALAGDMLLFVPLCCSGSDYSGGSLVRSNLRALREQFEDSGFPIVEISGSHGSQAIAFPLFVRYSPLNDTLRSLGDYPVVDEGTMSEIEREEEEEVWDTMLRSDFLQALESENGIAVDLSDCEESEIRDLFWSACERTNTYFEHTDEGAWIDIDPLTDSISREEALAIPGAKSASEEEESEALALFRALDLALPCGLSVYYSDPSMDRRPLIEARERIEEALSAFGIHSRDSEEISPGLGFVLEIARFGSPERIRQNAERISESARSIGLGLARTDRERKDIEEREREAREREEIERAHSEAHKENDRRNGAGS